MPKIDVSNLSESELQSVRLLASNMANRADTMAKKLAPLVTSDLDRLHAAKQEWEGGRFTVLFRLTDGLTPEEIDSLPDPKAKTGNNPAWFKMARLADGKEKWEEVYFYHLMALDFPANQAKLKRIDVLQRSMGDPTKVNQTDVTDDIKNMTIDYRESEIKRLTDEISSSVRSVTGAFELMHQLRAVESLKHVEAFPLYKLGPDGMPLDGEDGRARVIENSKTPIVIQSTIKGRAAIDRTLVGIDTFLRLDPAKAAETAGGTYQSLMATAKRQKPTDEQGTGQTQGETNAKPQEINTADTALARIMDVYEYFNRAAHDTSKTAWELLEKNLHEKGNDEMFHAACALHEYLGSLIGNPRDQSRYEALDKAYREAAKKQAA